jgi:hypothetical protein
MSWSVTRHRTTVLTRRFRGASRGNRLSLDTGGRETAKLLRRRATEATVSISRSLAPHRPVDHHDHIWPECEGSRCIDAVRERPLDSPNMPSLTHLGVLSGRCERATGERPHQRRRVEARVPLRCARPEDSLLQIPRNPSLTSLVRQAGKVSLPLKVRQLLSGSRPIAGASRL